MPIYRVETFAQKEGAIGAHGTERRVYTVQANSIQEARLAAIDAAYKEGGLQHVKPVGRVTMLSDMQALKEGWR